MNKLAILKYHIHIYVFMYTHTHTHTHTHPYIQIHIYTQIYMCVTMCICDNYINKKWIITTKSKDTDNEETIHRYMFLELILLTKIYILLA